MPLVLELCVASQSPAKICWYRKNFEIRPSTQINIISEKDNHLKVVYQNPPEGIYKAVVTNEFGIANYEVRVLVEFPNGRHSSENQIDKDAPAFLRRASQSSESLNTKPEFNLKKRASIPKNENLPKPPKFIPPFLEPFKHVNEGDVLVLECKTDAIPEAKFSWRQNNFEVKNNKQIKIERVDINHCKATFQKPTNGRFEVTAENSMGKDTAFSKVIIKYPNQKVQKNEANKTEYISDKDVNKSLNDKPVLKTKNIKLLKEESKKNEKEIVKDIQTIEDITIPLTENLQKEEQIKSLKKIFNVLEQKQNNEEKIKKLSQEFENTFSKEVAQKIADELISEKKIEEVIKTTLDQKPPRFLKTLEELLPETEISEGTQLYIEVNVDKENTQSCMFQWFINNRLIPPEYIEFNDHSSILNVPEIKKNMEGMLIVSVTNFYGADRSSINLSIKSGKILIKLTTK